MTQENDFFIVTPKAQATKEKGKKMNFIKVESFRTSENTIKKCKKTTQIQKSRQSAYDSIVPLLGIYPDK